MKICRAGLKTKVLNPDRETLCRSASALTTLTADTAKSTQHEDEFVSECLGSDPYLHRLKLDVSGMHIRYVNGTNRCVDLPSQPMDVGQLRIHQHQR